MKKRILVFLILLCVCCVFVACKPEVCQHSWSDWVSDGQGTDSRFCNLCQEQQTQPTPGYQPPTDCQHVWSDWVSDGQGTDSRHCTLCQKSETQPTEGYKPEPQLTQSKVAFSTPSSQVLLYTASTVKVEDTQLPLYNVKVNNSHKWVANPTSRDDVGVGYFFLEGKTQVTFSCQGMESCVIRPLASGVTATVANGVATFTLSSAGNYSIEPNGDATKAVFLFVSTFDKMEDNNGNFQKIITFPRGLHTSENNPNIVNNTVTLHSNTKVILQDGAVVRARFVANNAANVAICGTGIIDGSTFERNPTTNKVTVPLDFNYCTGVKLSNFSVLDPAGWCVNWYFCTDSNIDGIKIISSRSNGDGISIQSCQRIDVTNCFVRSWDDSLVVKNYPQWSDRNKEGTTRDISFSNCIIWTDLAQCMEIGYETVGEVMDNISFTNITVLHNFHKPVISIHNGNNANITNVKYDTITVEDASMGRGDAGGNNQLVEIAVEFNSTWSTNHKTTALGSIDGVVVKNVSVLDGNIALPIRVAGSRDMRSGYGASIHYVKNVVFDNIWAPQKAITSNYAYLSINEYANASFVKGSKPILATVAQSLTAEQLQDYTDNAVVSIIE